MAPAPDYEEIARLEFECQIDDTPADDLIDHIDGQLAADAALDETGVPILHMVGQPSDLVVEPLEGDLEDELGAHCHGERGPAWMGGLLQGVGGRPEFASKVLCRHHDGPECWRVDLSDGLSVHGR